MPRGGEAAAPLPAPGSTGGTPGRGASHGGRAWNERGGSSPRSLRGSGGSPGDRNCSRGPRRPEDPGLPPSAGQHCPRRPGPGLDERPSLAAGSARRAGAGRAALGSAGLVALG